LYRRVADPLNAFLAGFRGNGVEAPWLTNGILLDPKEFS